MQRLSDFLNFYVHDRLCNHPEWKGITVILSDSNVPGEGEAKIFDFIRRQRVQASYQPNTGHVVCGVDGDLILLGLATHEPNFTIIREDHQLRKFNYVSLNVLRHCLSRELEIPNMPANLEYDFERALDDFIGMCFLVGNDFIPSLLKQKTPFDKLCNLFKQTVCEAHVNIHAFIIIHMSLEYA